ncbi:MAG: TatD family hydrolase [Coriobacteriales bacterium]|nr:TatD family hydrolase [Coriobacteriales bacterium]
MRTVSSAASSVASGEAPEQVFYDTLLRDAKHKVVEAPVFAPGTRIADTHAHLDMLHHPGLALARASALGVAFVVSVIDPTEDPSFTLSNLESWQREAEELLADKGTVPIMARPPLSAPEVALIIGCHPHNASAYNQAVEDQLVLALTGDARVVGIGEIGLDYHYDNSPREVQQAVFRRQIRLAHEHQSTVTLHLREAHEDGLRILKEEGIPKKGVLLHCFNLNYAALEPFLELGALVAFGGPLTFKKCDDVREAAAKAPLDRLMTETDCPFMAPVPVRGSVCEPASVVFTARQLGDLRQEPHALDQAFNNARRFFC